MTIIKLTSVETGESIKASLKGTKRTITSQFKRMYKGCEQISCMTGKPYLTAIIDNEKFIVDFK